MEKSTLLKVRFVRLEKIYKAGLKELDNILEKKDIEIPEKLPKKIIIKDVALDRYNDVFSSLIKDILLKKDIL